MAAGGRWQCRWIDPDGTPVRLTLVASAAHPDGAGVDVPSAEAPAAIGSGELCTAEYDEHGGVRAVRVAASAAPKAPPLWFLEVRESMARPPAVSLLAFTGQTAAGTLLEHSDAANVGVTSSDQLGAVRWYPASGEVDQVYVQPQWRRRSVANALLFAAGTLSLARRWPRLWGDGQRTELGEQLRAAAPWRDRAAELTHLAPPMTPDDGTPTR